MLLVDTMNWDLISKGLIKKIVCNSKSNKCILYQCKSCSGTAALNKFLNQELKKHEDDEQWDNTDRAISTTFTATYEEYKETLIDVIDDLTKHSYISKLKITSS